MSRILKRSFTAIISLLLCAIIMLGALSTAAPYEVAEARTIFDIENELKAYKSELANVQAELSEITKNIAELEGKSGQTAELLVQYQAEIEALEAEIMELETEKESIEQEMSSGTLANDVLLEKSKRIQQVMELIDEKTMRWLELSEYAT